MPYCICYTRLISLMFATLNSILHSLFPNWLYQRLIGDWNKEGLKKYASNTGWMFIGRAFSFLVSFFMIAIVARYLGPENLGKLSYAQSFIAIFSMFASLGIDNLLFRDLVSHPERENEILGTAFCIKLFFGVLTTIATVLTAFFLNSDKILTFIILILSLSFIVQPFNITSSVFGARVKSKYATIITIITSIVVPIMKLLVIFFGKGIIFFAGIIVLDIIINSTISLFLYTKVFKNHIRNWYFSGIYARSLIKHSLPLLFAGVSAYLFNRIDQVMLQNMIGPTSVGLYNSAVQITELVAGFIPGIIIGSLLPAIINAKKISADMYIKRVRQLVIFIFSMSVILVSAIALLAPVIVSIIYGTEFSVSASILRIYVWSSTLAILVSILQQHLVNEGLTHTFFVLSATTAVFNILANLVLIPKYGVYGAAFSTIASLLLYLILPLLSTELRKLYSSIIILKPRA